MRRRLPPVCCRRPRRTRSGPHPVSPATVCRQRGQLASSRSKPLRPVRGGGQPVQQGAGAPPEQRGRSRWSRPARRPAPEQRAGPAPAQPQLQAGLRSPWRSGRVQVQPADSATNVPGGCASELVSISTAPSRQSRKRQVAPTHPLVHARRRRLQVVAGVGTDVAAQPGHRAAPALLRLARDRHRCRRPAHTVTPRRARRRTRGSGGRRGRCAARTPDHVHQDPAQAEPARHRGGARPPTAGRARRRRAPGRGSRRRCDRLVEQPAQLPSGCPPRGDVISQSRSAFQSADAHGSTYSRTISTTPNQSSSTVPCA